MQCVASPVQKNRLQAATTGDKQKHVVKVQPKQCSATEFSKVEEHSV